MKVPAHVNFQVWVRDYALEIGTAEFDCSKALDDLPLWLVTGIESGRADHVTDDVYREAVELGIVAAHDGPFDCYIDDQDALDAYIAARESGRE